MNVRFVLFDLGNVIVDWQPLRLYRELFDSEDEAQAFCRDICNLGWHTAHDRGVSFADNAAKLIAAHPHYRHEIQAWRTRWLDMFEGYVPGMDVLVETLAARDVVLYGLSNLSAEIAEETFDAFPVIRRLKDVVVSGAEGVVKPDPAIYHIALARMGSPPPGEVLFVDDRADNIAAAEAIGFQGHVFESADLLRVKLADIGLL
ncbi:MAG: HAD family phosphatase [Pseudomonadota bacterium]